LAKFAKVFSNFAQKIA